MRCEEIQDRLDEYVDGELPQESAATVVEHLGGCTDCRRRERSLRRLLERAAALPRRMEPRRDLWPEIASRLHRSPRQRRFPRRGTAGLPPWVATALAASLAALTLAGVLWFQLSSTRTTGLQDGLPGGSPTTEAPTTGVRPASDRRPEADLDVENARRELRRALEARKASLEPATVAVIEKNLRVIDQAIAEIQAALAEDPGNRELQQLLRHSRQREIALLRTAAFLPSQT
jgi:hypothetical protein